MKEPTSAEVEQTTAWEAMISRSPFPMFEYYAQKIEALRPLNLLRSVREL